MLNKYWNHYYVIIYPNIISRSSNVKIDACVQTASESLEDITEMIFENGCGINLGSKEFPFDADGSMKDECWELDIDSAIVGDLNNTSAFSLTDKIDPLYATIKITSDGRFIERSQCEIDPSFYGCIYPQDITSYTNSNASSPKSGVYTKINKQNRHQTFASQSNDLHVPYIGSRLNFEQIMLIRTHLGLTTDSTMTSGIGYDYPSLDKDVYFSNTPDIPRRNYGSSVINFITELRKDDNSFYHSPHNPQVDLLKPSTENLDKKWSKCYIYSPIWNNKRTLLNLSAHISETPLSEPMVPKKFINKMFHTLHSTYPEDLSDNVSNISIRSQSKIQYCYPQNFSDSSLIEEINKFRHMDSEVDLDVSVLSKERKAAQIYQRGSNSFNEVNVPSKVRTGNIHGLCDEKIFLQPLMERSCEDEYFRRGLLSSLDCINV